MNINYNRISDNSGDVHIYQVQPEINITIQVVQEKPKKRWFHKLLHWFVGLTGGAFKLTDGSEKN